MTVTRNKANLWSAGARALVAGALLFVLAASPASAQLIPKSNVGGGAVTANVTVEEPATGLPGVAQGCQPARTTVVGEAPAVVLNTVLTGYVGSVQITGEAVSECENAESGDGDIVLEAHGVGPTLSRIDCGPYTENPGQAKLEGEFTRVAGTILVQAEGPCTINKFALAQVRFVAELQAVPTEDDHTTPATSANVKYAKLAGSFGLGTL
jgi:hypothetical protein